jgi:hypothetical protein
MCAWRICGRSPVHASVLASVRVRVCVRGCLYACLFDGRSTQHDGVNEFYCVAPFGQCLAGGPVVRCAFDDGHNWPFYYEQERAYFAETVWAFFLGNPLSAEAVDARDAEAAAAAAAAAGGGQ